MGMAGFWDNRDRAQKLMDESSGLKRKIEPLDFAQKNLDDLEVMVELSESEPESSQVAIEKDLEADVARLMTSLEALELRTLLSGAHDSKSCILSINAGAGGTESCDWADMLMRMYQRWCEQREYKAEITDILPGDTAGIKSVSLMIEGENAYGFCKAERGVHRLVRISPFDSNKRRHTSFASVDVIAEIDDEIDMAGLEEMRRNEEVEKIEIKPQVHEWKFKKSGRSIIVLGEGRLVNLSNATGHPSFVMSNSFTNQTLAQLELQERAESYGKNVVTLPKHLDEKVARLHLDKFGAKLTVLTDKQSNYLGLPKDGPFKSDQYRY